MQSSLSLHRRRNHSPSSMVLTKSCARLSAMRDQLGDVVGWKICSMLFLVFVNVRLEARYGSKVRDRTAERVIRWISRKEAWKAEGDRATKGHFHACQ